MPQLMGAPVAQGRCMAPAPALASKSFAGNRAAFQPATQRAMPQSRGSLQVQSALSRKGKEETMEKLVPLLEGSMVVMGLRYQGLTVKEMQGLRSALPKEGAKLVVCKNSLVKRAADEVAGWSELKAAAKGDTAWLFIKEDHVAASVKAYLDYQTKLRMALPKEQRDDFKLLNISGGAMDGKLISQADVARLEKLPTKQQLIGTIARMIKRVPTKLAVSIKQVPTKVALGVKALADFDDDKALLVGAVCKPGAKAEPAAAAAEA